MIELQLLGGLTIEGPELSPSSAARRRHPMALLALVAAMAPQPVGRDRLMTLLWPESDSERASNSLRQTLFRLRRDLGEDLFLPESAAGLQLDPDRVTVDLWTFREALGRHAPADAVAVYDGPFLDGFHIGGLADFDRWVESEREQTARAHAGALDTLAREAEDQGRLDEAVTWRRRQAAADPYSSRTALALLKALTAAGDRTGALQYASVYENLVREDLEAAPDPAVTEFVELLRQGRAPVEVGRAPRGGRDRPASGPPTPADTEKGTVVPTSQSAAIIRHPDPAVVATPAGAGADIESEGGGSKLGRGAGILAAVVLLGITGVLTLRPARVEEAAAPPVIVLASGNTNQGGRDLANTLIACDGPACPRDALPSAAFVVPRHGAYAPPTAGTGFIATVPDGTTRPSPGYSCCTTATFAREFELPANATSARITIGVLADNQATVSLNGVEFGGHAEQHAPENYTGPEHPTFSFTFAPHPSGTNRLELHLWNGGGAIALYYHAVVTFEVADDADQDGTSDASDTYPNSDIRPTIFVGECDSGVTNQYLTDPPGATLADLVRQATQDRGGPTQLTRALETLARGWTDAALIAEADVMRITDCARDPG